MDDWEWLRTTVVVLAWVAVAGGTVLAALWVALGGLRAFGPEDQLLVQTGAAPERDRERETAFSSAGVGVHGLVGIGTAALITYAATNDDRTAGYVAGLIAVVLTAVPGVIMFLRWREREPRQPRVGRRRPPRVEHRLPASGVYAHGFFSALVAIGLVVLLIVD
jgi:hypothetical protein